MHHRILYLQYYVYENETNEKENRITSLHLLSDFIWEKTGVCTPSLARRLYSSPSPSKNATYGMNKHLLLASPFNIYFNINFHFHLEYFSITFPPFSSYIFRYFPHIDQSGPMREA
jgi:hypothetical protein